MQFLNEYLSHVLLFKLDNCDVLWIVMSLAQHINVATVDTSSVLRDDSYQYIIPKK